MSSPKNGSNDKKYSSDSTDEYYNSEDPAKDDVINKPEEKKSKDGALQISIKKRGCTSEETDKNPSKKNKVDDDVGDVGSDVSGKDSGGEDDHDVEDDQVDDKYGEEDDGSEDDQDDNNSGEDDDGDDSERTITD